MDISTQTRKRSSNERLEELEKRVRQLERTWSAALALVSLSEAKNTPKRVRFEQQQLQVDANESGAAPVVTEDDKKAQVRQQALAMLKANHDPTDVANKLNLSIKTVRAWQAWRTMGKYE